MKKISFFAITIAIALMTISVSSVQAQDRSPELKLRVLSEMPLNEPTAKILVYYTETKVKIPVKDSVDEGKIIHYEPLKVSIDYLLDTITVDASYLENELQILRAYRWPGHPAIIPNNSEEEKTSWLGFWISEEKRTDTTKFVYHKSTQEVSVTRLVNISHESRFRYWLLGSWIFVLFATLLYRLFKKTARQILDGDSAVKNWQKWLYFLIVIGWVISVFSIIFSKSILIAIVGLIIAFFIHCHRENKRVKTPVDG